MGYAVDHLKLPEEGSWIAVTRVDEDGTVTRLAYLPEIAGVPACRIEEIQATEQGTIVITERHELFMRGTELSEPERLVTLEEVAPILEPYKPEGV